MIADSSGGELLLEGLVRSHSGIFRATFARVRRDHLNAADRRSSHID